MSRRWLAALLMVSGCGPGAAAETIRPKDPTASGTLGEAECRSVDKGGEPLVVDWKPEQRGDLEVTMQEGVAVVDYSCKGIKLVKDCKIEGKYGFIGMTKKEQLVRLQSSDEVKANLPLSGATIGGELQRGSTVDIAMVMVGKQRTTWSEPTKDDLVGRCDGATHYVRGATVGAFVMETGTDAKVRAVAEVFGASGSAGSSSAKQTRNQEGEITDCAKATPDAAKPPPQCGAPIRLVLAPIAPAPAKGEPPPEKPAQPAAGAGTAELACPAGLVRAEGKCAKPESVPAYQCEPGSVQECKAQCDKGHAGSCGALGAIYANGGAGQARDEAKAAPVLGKACDGGDMQGCVTLGQLTWDGRGAAQDKPAAAALFRKGCENGNAAGCRMLATAHKAGGGVTQDDGKAAALFQQACDGGDDQGCAGAASAYGAGKGVAQDMGRAVELHRRACDGSVAASCNELGLLHEAGGPGVGKNPILAEMMYRRACYRGSAEGCVHLGRLVMAKNASEAKMHLNMGCARQARLGCAILKVAYGEQRPFVPDIAQKNELMGTCARGNARDCAILGILDAAMGMPTGKHNLDRACTMGERWVCDLAKNVK